MLKPCVLTKEMRELIGDALARASWTDVALYEMADKLSELFYCHEKVVFSVIMTDETFGAIDGEVIGSPRP